MTHTNGADKSDCSCNIRQLILEKIWRLSKALEKIFLENYFIPQSFLELALKQ